MHHVRATHSPPSQQTLVAHLWSQLPPIQQQQLVTVLTQMMMAQIATLEKGGGHEF
ncbi:hypothetical protein IQ268_31845 [Oculatella sp. LEGE 06141]|uniref:hypothetical protein n=1 Tax=Oculatella sp. LEGE 06141 TaxID=1828648 RepID=UPI00188158B9|nr:hypothetical protein [Oculatella sp. LEGE 06141]MBE9183126.1 hypothetical protein [Oculatella sp. LEGE 06141]